MILRRITKHVREQNWTAIAIDFVIVVTGVFMGIQLGNWNEDRSKRVEEREIVLQLIAEARETAIEIEGGMVGNQLRLDASREAHQALRASSLTDEQTAQLHDNLSELGPWAGNHVVAATLDRLINADRLSLISDPDLRLVISRYNQEVQRRSVGTQNVGSMNLEHLTAMRNHIDFDLRDGAGEVVSPTRELLENDLLERRVGQFHMNYQIFRGFLADADAANSAYLARLEEYAASKGWLE